MHTSTTLQELSSLARLGAGDLLFPHQSKSQKQIPESALATMAQSRSRGGLRDDSFEEQGRYS